MEHNPILENWDELAELYDAALAEAPETREAWLRRATSDRPALLPSLLELLNSPSGGILDQSAADLIDQLAPNPLAAGTPLLVPGQTLQGRFEIRGFLGQGGMGEVYRAWDRELSVDVALKLLRSEQAERPSSLERFRREIALARQIAHPNVCRAYDLVRLESPGSPDLIFFVMEFLDGETLFQQLKRTGPASSSSALPLARQIAAGLDAVHAAGIIHRDLKPANIMLVANTDGTTRAVVTDFGLASPERTGNTTPASTGQLMGTPGYLAPELWVGQTPTPAADLFSYGMVLRDLLLGVTPTEAKLPADWSRVINALTVTDPAARPVSATQALTKLDPPRFTRRQLTWGAVGLSATAGLATYPLWRPSPSLPTGTKLLLVPANGPASGSPDLVSQILHDQLRQSAQIEVLDPARIRDLAPLVYQPLNAPLDASKARQIAVRERAPLVLFASVAPLGSGLVLNLALEHQDGGSGHSLGQQSFPARDAQDLFSASRQAALWVRRLAGENRDSLTSLDHKPDEVSTPSLDALREYMRAERFRREGDPDGAIRGFDSALRYDARFAMAHFRKADILASRSRHADSLNAYRESLRALAARPISTREQLRLEAMLFYDTADYSKSDHAYEQYIHHYTADDYGYAFRTSVLYHLGRHGEALASAEKAYSINPARSAASVGRYLQLCELGRFDQASPVLDKLVELGLKDHKPYFAALAALCQGNATAARQLTLEAFQAAGPAMRSIFGLTHAAVLIEAQDQDAATRFLTPLLETLESSGNTADAAAALVQLAHLERHPQKSQALLVRAAALDSSVNQIQNSVAVTLAKGTPTQAQHFAALLDPGEDFACLRAARAQIQGQILLASHRTKEAIVALREAASQSAPVRPAPVLAQALMASGEKTEAALLTSSLSPTFLWRSRNFPPPGFWRQTLQLAVQLNPEAPVATSALRQLKALGSA